MNQYNLPEAVKDIKSAFSKLIENGCKTLAVGGDHTITYPILQAYKVSEFYSTTDISPVLLVFAGTAQQTSLSIKAWVFFLSFFMNP